MIFIINDLWYNHLYNDRNFVTIGGISSDSVLVKSATDLIGINPLTFDTSKASPNGIKNINLFDRLRLFDFLTKIDFNLLLPFYDLSVADYTEEIQDTTEPLFPSIVYGCLDSNANNTIEQVDGTIYYQDDSCDFSYTLSWSEVETEQNLNLHQNFQREDHLFYKFVLNKRPIHQLRSNKD